MRFKQQLVNYVIVFIYFFIFGGHSSFSQKIDFNLRYGIPTNQFKPYYTSHKKDQWVRLRSVADITAIIDYSIPLKFNTYFFIGLEFGNTRGYLPIIGVGEDRRLLENIAYNKQRISLRWLGLGKQFELIENKLYFEANIVMLSRFYLGNSKRYFSDYKSNGDDWIEYRYDIRIYNNKLDKSDSRINFFDLYLSTEFGLKLSGIITDDLDWNFILNYYRNLYSCYNYELDYKYYYLGEEEPHSLYDNAWDQSFEESNLIQREHYFALGFGMSFKF